MLCGREWHFYLSVLLYRSNSWHMDRAGLAPKCAAQDPELTVNVSESPLGIFGAGWQMGLEGTAWVPPARLAGRIRESYLFWRENTQGASVLPHGHPHLGQQGFPAGSRACQNCTSPGSHPSLLPVCPLGMPRAHQVQLEPMGVTKLPLSQPTHLSIRIASVLRSFSSQVSFSSAMIFSVSWWGEGGSVFWTFWLGSAMELAPLSAWF